MSSPSVAASAEETETVRRIVQRLDAMPQEHARFVACFAYILSRGFAKSGSREGPFLVSGPENR